jgi:hypothetical protein
LKKGRSTADGADDEIITENTEEPTSSKKGKKVVRHTPDNTPDSTTQPSTSIPKGAQVADTGLEQDEESDDSGSNSGDESTNGTATPTNGTATPTNGTATPKPVGDGQVLMDQYFTALKIPINDFTKRTFKKEVLLEMSGSALADLYLIVHKEYQSAKDFEIQHLDSHDRVRFFILRDNFNIITKAGIELGLLYPECKHPVYPYESALNPCKLCPN